MTVKIMEDGGFKLYPDGNDSQLTLKEFIHRVSYEPRNNK